MTERQQIAETRFGKGERALPGNPSLGQLNQLGKDGWGAWTTHMQPHLEARVRAAGLDERIAAVVLKTAWTKFPQIVRDTGRRPDLNVTWLITGLVDAYTTYVQHGKRFGQAAVAAVHVEARGEVQKPPPKTPPENSAPPPRTPGRTGRAPRHDAPQPVALDDTRMVGLTTAHWQLLRLVDGQRVSMRTAARRADVDFSAAGKMLDAARRTYSSKGDS